MTMIASLRVVRADNGEQFLMGCYAGNACGCQIKGAGICGDPLRIEYCPQHKAAPQLMELAVRIESGYYTASKHARAYARDAIAAAGDMPHQIIHRLGGEDALPAAGE